MLQSTNDFVIIFIDLRNAKKIMAKTIRETQKCCPCDGPWCLLLLSFFLNYLKLVEDYFSSRKLKSMFSVAESVKSRFFYFP